MIKIKLKKSYISTNIFVPV